MLPTEFDLREAELLSQLPEEFRAAVSMYAYDQGHSAGREDVISHLSGLVAMLKDPINKFKENILADFID